MTLPSRTTSVTRALQRISRTPASNGERDAAADQPDAGNRKSRRRQTALAATMGFHDMRVTLPCTVTDMSGTGARLELSPAIVKQVGDGDHLSSQMLLILKADRMQVDCEIKWRRSGRIGVRFLSPPRPIVARATR